MLKLYDSVSYSLEEVDNHLFRSRDELDRLFDRLDSGLEVLQDTYSSIDNKKEMLSNIEKYSLEDISNEIATRPDYSVIGMEMTTYSMESNGSYYGLYFSLEEDKSIISKIIDFIKKILTAIKDGIVKVFKWIGEKLGLVKKKKDTVTTSYKMEIKVRKEKKVEKTPINNFTDKQFNKIFKDFTTYIYLEGELNSKNIVNNIDINRDNLAKITKNMENAKPDQLSDIFEKLIEMKIYRNINDYNKNVSEKFNTNLSGVFSAFGKIDKNRLSILNEEKNKDTVNIYYKETTVTYKPKKEDIKLFKDHIDSIDITLLNQMIINTELFKLINSSESEKGLSKGIEKLEAMIPKITDKDVLNYYKEIIATAPKYVMDSLTSSLVITNDTLDLYNTFLENNKVSDKKE